MRIALLAPLYESVPPRAYGGTERVVYQLAHGLAAQGFDVTLFASGDSLAPARLIPILPEATRLARPPILDAAPYHFKMLAEVASHAAEFDVIHNHHDYWMLPLSQMVSTPVVTTLHGRLDQPNITAAYHSYEPSGGYVSISHSQRRALPWLDWRATIHHGFDFSRFTFSPKPGGYLAFLGRMSPEKRPDWAIDIAQAAGIPLKMAAKVEGASDREFFETRVKPRIDGKFIEYVGEIGEHEKCDFLGGALATVFPIDWPEPFGLVMLESLACGTPVLARPMGSVPEILCDGVTGFVDSDVQVLARRAREIGVISRQGCRRWVQERFSVERMTEGYIDVYRSLRADRRGRDLVYPLQRASDGNR